ncbi:MAG: saccharopine dehydrogenase C-terminal domain-containing protein [Candidatus Thermoplasmatota archaeon]
MNILILGAGMMARAIAYDLCRYSKSSLITIADNNKDSLRLMRDFLPDFSFNYVKLNVEDTSGISGIFKKMDIVISAVPYRYNYILAKQAVRACTNFIDLGGNNEIVQRELSLKEKAERAGVIIIPDCGLAPGLVSVITRDIVEHMSSIDYVKIRVGGLPVHPQPPLDYQIVFSVDGLINEYVEDAVVLDNKKIIYKPSLTEVEKIRFKRPFGALEAFLTSGGCSTLPYTYKDKVGYLDYKTIRYPGHCEKIKLLFDLGLADKKPIPAGNKKITPREVLTHLLNKNLPSEGDDVVLLRVYGRGVINDKRYVSTYSMIDYGEPEHGISAMMRTTGYPVSVTAQMIQQGVIKEHGVYTPEEVIPPVLFLRELRKRGLVIKKRKQPV